MAAEVAIDIIKTFPGRPPISAAFTYPLEQATALVLFGPSGSGKTTVLRSIAGLEWPERGTIRFISRTWLDTTSRIRVSPQERRIGYMPQDYALFPSYTVVGNIGYGLGELSSSDRKKRVDELVDLFQFPTVSALAKHLNGEEAAPRVSSRAERRLAARQRRAQ